MALQAEYKRGEVVYVTLKNGNVADLNAGDLVADAGSGVIGPLADGGALLGVCREDIPKNKTGTVEIPCGAVYKVKAASGATFNLLDPIYAAGNGEFDTGSQGDVACGYAVDVAPTAGGHFRAVLISAWFNPKAHA